MINTVESFLNRLGNFPESKLPSEYNTPQVRRVFVYASFGFLNSLLAHVSLYQSEANKDMFFTMWYGVYNENSRELTYASGGHPPAILFNGNPSNGSNINLLRTPNNVIGGISESTFTTNTCLIEQNSALYVYSDGVYEVEKPDGSMWRFKEFTDYLQKVRSDNHSVLDRLYGHVKELGNSEVLEDDFTIMEVVFA